MTALEAHPIALEFPELDADTFNDLVANMRAHGFDQTHPIVLFEGQILDGRNRYRAAQVARVPIVTREFAGDWDAAVEFSLRENLWRRHLTPGQRALVAEGIADLKGGRPKNSANLQSKNVSVESAATKVHVAPRTVQYARELRKINPKAAERVKAGKESLNSALRNAKAAAAPPPPPKGPPPPPIDAARRQITPKAASALLTGRERMGDIVKRLKGLRKELAALAGEALGRKLHAQSVDTDCKNLIHQLETALPYTSCPLSADCDSKCHLCQGTQWVTKLQWDGIPADIRGVA